MNVKSISDRPLVVVKYPDPCLRSVCAPITEFNEELESLGRDMLELMKARRGIGLAAPQVGIMLRMFVCNHTGLPQDDRIVINPDISRLEGVEEGEEGCLSIPEVLVKVRRAAKCRLCACDTRGQTFEVEASDLEARVWQHETDHLNGRLILDYMDDASQIANRRALKYLESVYQS